MLQYSIIEWLIPMLAAYLAGCLNTGYYLVRLFTGEDIRTRHSLSAGARNVGRALGPMGFIVTFLGDSGKGIAVLAAAKALSLPSHLVPWLIPLVVAGHIWPVQLRFRGGKGLATAIGACGALLLPPAAGVDAAYFPAATAIPALATAWGMVVFAHRKNLRRGAWTWMPAPKQGPEPSVIEGRRDQ